MKSNSKAVRDQIDTHILDTVLDEYGDNYTDVISACNRVYSEFIRVANFPQNIQRYPNIQSRFSDYLCGIPWNFLIYPYEITEFLNNLGINPQNKQYTSDQSMKLYHHLILAQVLKHKTI
jgi:hypothetical protein